ncbi:hypothetical protein AB1Y20_005966 [Prymnesium parvum]|uniref:Uncharacterized protein n=1 Tax=Prymnesium parvum TaxID=97485 RepID=A0AB34J3C2_PRYPA
MHRKPSYPASARLTAHRLLDDVEARLEAALARAALADHRASRASRPPRPPSPPPPATHVPPALLVSNGGHHARLFYAIPPEAGVAIKRRRDAARRASLRPPEDAAALSHYGIQMLTDFDRAAQLGGLAQYIPAHLAHARPHPCARARFNSLLARVQQAQLEAAMEARAAPRQLAPPPRAVSAHCGAGSVGTQAERRVAATRDPIWRRDNSTCARFAVAPVCAARRRGGVARVAEVNAWAEFIREPSSRPHLAELNLEVVPHIRADVVVE